MILDRGSIVMRRQTAGLRRRRRKPSRPKEPTAIARAYFAELLELLERARGMVTRRIVPRLSLLAAQARQARGLAPHTDAPSDINEEMDRISAEFYEGLPNDRLRVIARRYGLRTSEFQKEQLEKQIAAQVGIEIPLGDPELGPRLQQYTAENVSLIKSIPQRYFDQVEKEILTGLSNGARWEEIAEDIEERFGVARSSAQLIARDQVGKFFGSMNEARQTALGIEFYRWRTVRDARVRSEHEDREGKIFRWDDPPEDGPPGFPINCRCYPEPILDELLDPEP